MKTKIDRFQNIPSSILEATAAYFENKSIFTTGGTGFFGKSMLSVVQELNLSLGLNIKITVLSRDPMSFKKNFSDLTSSPQFKFLKGDVIDFEIPTEKYDCVLHFATPASAQMNLEKPFEMFQVIVKGTERVLDMARRCSVSQFLLASSGAVYGVQPSEVAHISENYLGAPDTAECSSAYGEGKRTVELMGNLYSSQYGFEHKIARCFAFVGPYLDFNGTFAIGNLIRDAIHGKTLKINGDGTPYRSYLYADDLVFWLLTILSKGRNRTPYNVGSNRDLQIRELAKKVKEIVNPNVEISIAKVPNLQAKPARYVPSIERAQNELNLNVWTPLEESIGRTALAYQTKILNAV